MALHNVLDVGCGTGIWAIEFADEHPSAAVLGIDLSPIQPNFVPPNCRFKVDDVNDDWTFGENHFDFIHIRAMIGCVPDWVELHRKSLREAGYVNVTERRIKLPIGMWPKDKQLKQWVER
ncbi:hypothetical protein NW754_015687 [Fusarium falciforme]|nr:hypothetical protein NW754_015687 [Fusarium falciforme]